MSSDLEHIPEPVYRKMSMTHHDFSDHTGDALSYVGYVLFQYSCEATLAVGKDSFVARIYRSSSLRR